MLYAPDAAVVEDRLWSQRLERFAPQQLVHETLEWTPAEFALRLDSLVGRNQRATPSSSTSNSASASASASCLPRLLAHLDALIEQSALLFASGSGHSQSSERNHSASERSRPRTRALAAILSHVVVLLRRLHCFLASEPPLPNQLLARVTQLWLNIHSLASRRYACSQSSHVKATSAPVALSLLYFHLVLRSRM